LVLTVSQADRDHYAGSARAVMLAPNGVDDDRFDIPIGQDAARVLFFGQLGYAPNDVGLRRFLAEWPSITAALPEAQLRVAGTGMSPALTDEIASLPQAEPLGFVENLDAELRAARVVIAPLWQGGGTRIKVLEAMAAGRAVAGTPVGVEQIGFRDGEHGRVADEPEALARAVSELLHDPPAARRLGERGREHARRYRWEETLASARAHYEGTARRAHGEQPLSLE
jgi:glycosyltransferase involved in cell wall biosynthesis